ncbi:MAG: hypothetical protein ACEPO2_03400 [Pelagibaca sp.]
MMTPEPKTPTGPTQQSALGWRDLIQSNSDTGTIEGFALEQLIDMQRDRSLKSGESR